MAIDLVKTVRPKMQDSLDHLKEEFKNLRTSRATSGLVEDLMVDYYGTKTPLVQLAQISIPGPAAIVIQPFDKNSLGDIETAIRNSGLNINPVNDGRVVRLSLPPLTEERRRELVKLVDSKAEETRISVRTTRAEAWEQAQSAERAGEITEDDRYDIKDDLQKIADEFDKQIDILKEAKEKEIMQI